MTAYDSIGDDRDQETTGRTVVGMFRTRSNAEAASRDLKTAGFADEQIGVAMHEKDEQVDLLESAGGQAAEGAAAGALSGSVLGGLIGLLGSILVPGLGPIVVAGVLASTLAGAGIGAAAGGLIGALIGLGVPEEDARHFDQGLRQGAVLITVDAGPRTNEAVAILERHEPDFGPSRANRLLEKAQSAGTGAVGETTGTSRVGSPDIATRGIGDVGAGSSTGERGTSGRKAYAGRERRIMYDPAYEGPERRLAAV